MCFVSVARPHIYISSLAPWIDALFLKDSPSIGCREHDGACTYYSLYSIRLSLSNISEHTFHLCFANISHLPSLMACIHNISQSSTNALVLLQEHNLRFAWPLLCQIYIHIKYPTKSLSLQTWMICEIAKLKSKRLQFLSILVAKKLWITVNSCCIQNWNLKVET